MDYSRFCCLNESCPDFEKFDKGNITLKERYGKDNVALLVCRTCRKTFSERHGTPLFKCRVGEKKFITVLKTLAQGGSIRGAADVAGVDKNTVLRIIRVVGEHAREFNDFMLRDLKLSQIQVDEIWTYIKKRRVPLRKMEKS